VAAEPRSRRGLPSCPGGRGEICSGSESGAAGERPAVAVEAIERLSRLGGTRARSSGREDSTGRHGAFASRYSQAYSLGAAGAGGGLPHRRALLHSLGAAAVRSSIDRSAVVPEAGVACEFAKAERTLRSHAGASWLPRHRPLRRLSVDRRLPSGATGFVDSVSARRTHGIHVPPRTLH